MSPRGMRNFSLILKRNNLMRSGNWTRIDLTSSRTHNAVAVDLISIAFIRFCERAASAYSRCWTRARVIIGRSQWRLAQVSWTHKLIALVENTFPLLARGSDFNCVSYPDEHLLSLMHEFTCCDASCIHWSPINIVSILTSDE